MPLDIRLDYDRGVPVYRQIGDAVITALANRTLARDEQLPTIHELAARLKVNANTVARAYRELESAGYIVGKRGRGSFPAAAPPTKPSSKKMVLRALFEQAVAEAARHRISPDEMVETFRKMLCAT